MNLHFREIDCEKKFFQLQRKDQKSKHEMLQSLVASFSNVLKAGKSIPAENQTRWYYHTSLLKITNVQQELLKVTHIRIPGADIPPCLQDAIGCGRAVPSEKLSGTLKASVELQQRFMQKIKEKIGEKIQEKIEEEVTTKAEVTPEVKTKEEEEMEKEKRSRKQLCESQAAGLWGQRSICSLAQVVAPVAAVSHPEVVVPQFVGVVAQFAGVVAPFAAGPHVSGLSGPRLSSTIPYYLSM